jgi:hypothetical protein
MRDSKIVIIRMINDSKEAMNAQQNKFQKNTDKLLKEIRNTMKSRKEKFNKDIDTLKNIKLKFWK